MLELRNVTFGYDEKAVLQDISLHVRERQFAALVGPSGSGKTTLLKLALGLLEPGRGKVLVGGQPLNGKNAPHIGYVPQLETVDWNFPVTVEQVVLMGLARQSGLFPWARAQDKARLAEVLAQLEIEPLAKRHIRDLSGGQQQRVFLARALIGKPELLVLDEPTAGVDMRTAENVLHTLAHLNQRGITILMTTHDLNAAAAHIPWVICLNRRIIAQGAPEDVFTERILNETYEGDMIVLRHEGMVFVQQRPHHHTRHDLIPQPSEHEHPA